MIHPPAPFRARELPSYSILTINSPSLKFLAISARIFLFRLFIPASLSKNTFRRFRRNKAISTYMERPANTSIFFKRHPTFSVQCKIELGRRNFRLRAKPCLRNSCRLQILLDLLSDTHPLASFFGNSEIFISYLYNISVIPKCQEVFSDFLKFFFTKSKL